MLEHEILNKVNSESNDDNIILKRNEQGELISLDCREIVKGFLNKNSLSYKEIKIIKTNEGLSNYIFYVTVDSGLKLFLKIFNNKIDRKFEEIIIRLNAEQGNCAKILDTDYNYFRIEEFLEDVQKLDRKEILTENFFDILIHKIVNFNFLLMSEENKHVRAEKNVFEVLHQIFLNAQKAFESFTNKFDEWKTKNNFYATESSRENKDNDNYNDKNNNNYNGSINQKSETESSPKYIYKPDNEEKPFDAFRIENYEKIEHYLKKGKLSEILNEIFPEEFLRKLGKRQQTNLTEIPLFLNHDDVHLYNFLYKPDVNAYSGRKIDPNRNLTKENVLLIDYEYACFNIIGFDIVNFFIECFFNLEFPEYPFYQRLENSTKNIYDKVYYHKYLKFLNEFVKESAIKGFKINQDLGQEDFIELFGNYEFYCKICRLASVYWFYTAVQFLDFDSNVNKIGFNYVDYSIDRLSVYENFYKLD